MRIRAGIAMLVAALGMTGATHAAGLSPQARSRLAAGQPTWVLVELEGSAANRAADGERARRRLTHDDGAILGLRAQGFGALKAAVRTTVAAPDAAPIQDYAHLPITLWRISSLDALRRLEARPEVRAVHENKTLRVASVSDLPFINQPQTAVEGATGTGTTIAVIDGGLDANFQQYSDFGTCPSIGAPACRVVYNFDAYPNASTQTLHGTNVAAIALGVAPGARLAMFDVFNGNSTTSTDILNALNSIISMQATYNIVAVNMSLSDGSLHPSTCDDISPYASSIQTLQDAGIFSVVAAGNNGGKTGLSDPACGSKAISVGAVYDAAYGSISWPSIVAPNGMCTDASAPDEVACFSQSASYLSLLAPGTFVNAPSSTFQESGTSQAAPHVSGALAVLRARYPSEPLSQTLQRLQLTGVKDTDPGNGLAVPRINLLAATNMGTAVALSGSGPTQAVAGQSATYTLTITNNGPLTATNVALTDTLPGMAQVTATSAGCVVDYPNVSCPVTTLAPGASVTATITVKWAGSGPVYDTYVVTADQANTAPSSAAIGTPPGSSGDAPLPGWAYVLLGAGLLGVVARERQRAQ